VPELEVAVYGGVPDESVVKARSTGRQLPAVVILENHAVTAPSLERRRMCRMESPVASPPVCTGACWKDDHWTKRSCGHVKTFYGT